MSVNPFIIQKKDGDRRLPVTHNIIWQLVQQLKNMELIILVFIY